MALVNIAEVKIIIDTDLSDTDIDSFINMADKLVTDHLDSTNLDGATKKEIERWLTAHLISVSRERQTISEKIGDASVRFPDILGKGLDSTTYGQMVKILDTSHTLENIDKKEPNLIAIKSFDDE